MDQLQGIGIGVGNHVYEEIHSDMTRRLEGEICFPFGGRLDKTCDADILFLIIPFANLEYVLLT